MILVDALRVHRRCGSQPHRCNEDGSGGFSLIIVESWNSTVKAIAGTREPLHFYLAHNQEKKSKSPDTVMIPNGDGHISDIRDLNERERLGYGIPERVLPRIRSMLSTRQDPKMLVRLGRSMGNEPARKGMGRRPHLREPITFNLSHPLWRAAIDDV